MARRKGQGDMLDPQFGQGSFHGNSQALKALNRKSDTRPISPMTMMPKMIPGVKQRLAVGDHVSDA
jgi:hypothetical protein